KAGLSLPVGVAIDAENNLYTADVWAWRIRKVDPSGTITTVAGGGTKAANDADGRAATEATLVTPVSVAVDGSGSLFISERKNHRIRKVSPAGIITTVAGTGKQGFSGDNGPAIEAQSSLPYGLAVDGKGSLYIGDWGNSRVRLVNASG